LVVNIIERWEAERRLIGEIEIVDRLEKGKVGAARESRQVRSVSSPAIMTGLRRAERMPP
jgi:hypothetical protein